MVDFTGHLAFGALFALPAWFVWRKRASLAFVVLALVSSALPDGDVWLSGWFPALFHHHGVTHTVLFVVVASVLVGAVAALVLPRSLDRWFGRERVDAGSLFAFAFLAFLLGGLSHLFADLLSAPDISTPVEPFWPFFDKPFSVNVIYYDDPLWNSVFLLAMLVAHAAVAYLVDPVRHRFRFGRSAS